MGYPENPPKWPPPKYVVPISITVLIILGVTWFYWIGSRMTIRSGEIQLTDDLQKIKNGSFTVHKTASIMMGNGIQSDGIAGACLFADLNPNLPKNVPNGRKCHNNAECKGVPDSWEGLCDLTENTCWVRPGDGNRKDLCNKGVETVAGVEYPSNTLPFDISERTYTQPLTVDGQLIYWPNQPLQEPSLTFSFSDAFPGPVRWRVWACLNGANLVKDPDKGYIRPCQVAKEEYVKPGERMRVPGPWKWVPRSPLVSPANTEPTPLSKH